MSLYSMMIKLPVGKTLSHQELEGITRGLSQLVDQSVKNFSITFIEKKR